MKNNNAKELREEWLKVKKSLSIGEIKAIEAITLQHGLKISPMSYAIVSRQMEKNGYDGIPYIDCKTYNGWVNAGYRVKRGEKSKITGITWINVTEENKGNEEGNEEDGKSYIFPKKYHLFHASQTESIAA